MYMKTKNRKDETFFSMNELELLEHLNAIEQSLKTLEITQSVYKDEDEQILLAREILKFRKEESKVIFALIKVEDKSHSLKAKEGLKKQICAYMTQINQMDKRQKLSRNQVLLLENHLFSQIHHDLNNIIIEEYKGQINPHTNLAFAFNESDSVDINDLSNFLNNELKLLGNISIINYPTLKKFVKEFWCRLSTEFIDTQASIHYVLSPCV